MGLIDQAVDAAAAGDAKKAAAVLDQVRHTSGHIDGLDYQLALLAFASGDFPSAMLSLNRSIAEGEEVGACYGQRGLIANQRGPARGLHDFEAATQSAPFDAKGFFYWGEALRRSGKPQEALIHLRQAVERASTPAEQANYQLKVRLTQIELGREKEFAPELAAEMALARPPGDWVLTAAAQDMHSGNFAAAAADLNRARQLMDPAQLSGALRDYFFQGYRTEVPLARIYSEIMLPSTPSEPTPTPAATPAEALSLTLTAPPGASPAP
jgi:tetratricopeptide (TPR) repeat protein